MSTDREHRKRARGDGSGDGGQAIAEYAIIVAGLLGLFVLGSFTFLPDFIDALQRYYDSHYIMISLPIP